MGELIAKCEDNKQSNSESNWENLRAKMNMMFRVYSLPKVLDQFKNQLSDLIKSNYVKNQEQLDRISTELMKKIKNNKCVCIS